MVGATLLKERARTMSNATRVRSVPMLFLPPSARNHRSNRRAWCHWCCARGTKGRLFKLRDGPTDWYAAEAGRLVNLFQQVFLDKEKIALHAAHN